MVSFCPSPITPVLERRAPPPSEGATGLYCKSPCPQSNTVPVVSSQKNTSLPAVYNTKQQTDKLIFLQMLKHGFISSRVEITFFDHLAVEYFFTSNIEHFFCMEIV